MEKHEKDTCPFKKEIEEIIKKTGQKEWYENKDLYDLIVRLTAQTEVLSNKLDNTIRIVGKYNGLREDLLSIKKRIDYIETEKLAKNKIGDQIIKWSGWIIAIISLGFTAVKIFGW
ncbi:MAG TPA: hypothetical protein VKN64_07690 [Halanaerobiales bacterium]|nr:hypothetical protein [Halanaerobiales bacterium]